MSRVRSEGSHFHAGSRWDHAGHRRAVRTAGTALIAIVCIGGGVVLEQVAWLWMGPMLPTFSVAIWLTAVVWLWIATSSSRGSVQPDWGREPRPVLALQCPPQIRRSPQNLFAGLLTAGALMLCVALFLAHRAADQGWSLVPGDEPDWWQSVEILTLLALGGCIVGSAAFQMRRFRVSRHRWTTEMADPGAPRRVGEVVSNDLVNHVLRLTPDPDAAGPVDVTVCAGYGWMDLVPGDGVVVDGRLARRAWAALLYADTRVWVYIKSIDGQPDST